jgi:hypothetical protein
MANRDERRSPFGPALGDRRAALPAAFRELYLGDVERSVFRGHVVRAWNRPRLLRPVFGLLARWRVLFAEEGEQIPASLTIERSRARGDGPCEFWSRRFAFEKPRYIDALVFHDAGRERIVERFGSAVSVEVDWRLAFHPPDRLEIRTGAWAIRIGRMRIGLPLAMCPSVSVVERADLARPTFAVSFVVAHALLGRFWGYDGVFAADPAGESGA